MTKNKKKIKQYMVKNILKGLLVLLIASACSSDLDKGVTGWGTIDEISYLEENMLSNILGNSINFFDDYTCKLPTTRIHSRFQETADYGNWEILKSEEANYKLKISSNNKIFNGIYDIRFKKNEKDRMLMMILESDSMKLIARKGMLHYHSRLRLIEELERKTN